MAVKYRISYTSITDVAYTCDISNPDYAGGVIDVEGSVVYGMASVDDYSNPIRSKYLNISLNASTELDFEELLTEPERYWRVEFYRESDKLFFGYLSSEQARQSFTSDRWVLEVSALDPLAFLQDLAYVDPSGDLYTGVQSFIKIIAQALKLSFEDDSEAFNMFTYVGYEAKKYNAATETSTALTSGTFMSAVGTEQDAFFDEDSQETESCQEILEKILKVLQLTLYQINGTTWVLTNYIADQTSGNPAYLNCFDADGDAISDISLTAGPVVPLISHINSTDNLTDVMHANRDQNYYYMRGVDKLAVTHSYTYKESLLDNPEMDGLTSGGGTGWEVITSRATGDDGFIVFPRGLSTSDADDYAARSITPVYVVGGEKLTLRIQAEATVTSPSLLARVIFIIRLTSGGVEYFALDSSSDFPDIERRWESGSYAKGQGKFLPLNDGGIETVEYELPIVPPDLDGLLEVLFINPSTANNKLEYTVYYADLVSSGDVTGTTTLYTKDISESLQTEKLNVYLNTLQGQITENQLYNVSDGLTIHQMTDPSVPLSDITLARIYTLAKMKTLQKRKIFQGSFYNFMDINSLVEIDVLSTNKFRIIEYEFNTHENVGTVKLEEVTNTFIDGVDSTEFIFKSDIEPTLK